MTVTIYHNPNCSTSRKVLGLVRDAGHEPKVIEYLKTPPSRKALKDLLKQMSMKPRDILRKRGTPYDELGLDNPRLDDEAILDAIATGALRAQIRAVISNNPDATLLSPFVFNSSEKFSSGTGRARTRKV